MFEKNFSSTHKKILCVIGYPIEHSMSSIMHNTAIHELGLNYVYLAFNILPKSLKLAVEGIKTFNIIGINVTLPFKQKIMRYLDDIDPTAKKIGAVNVIKNDDGFLTGKNTDAEGGLKALINAGYTVSGKNIMLLGAGGASRALTYVLAKDANKTIIVNRTKKKAINLANDVRKDLGIKIEGKEYRNNILKDESNKADILVNTTPIGMYPNVDKSPIPAEFLHEDLIVFDIIYNPLETKLIKDATQKGCKTLGGLDMLVNQGVLAFEWWTNKKPNSSLMKKKVAEFLGNK